MTPTIYHNPRCGTSRNTLALLQEKGIAPQVIEYLKTPPDRATLAQLAQDCDEGASGLLRRKEALVAELGLDQPNIDDNRILDAIAEHPILLNRPVVVTAKGTRVCRPAERVLELL